VCKVKLQIAACGELGARNSEVSYNTREVFQLTQRFRKEKDNVWLQWGQGRDLQVGSKSGG